MRLPPSLIGILARKLVLGLIAKGTIASDHPERTIEKIARLLTADLSVEDEITEQARLLLLDRQQEIKGMDLEYHALLSRAKAQLASQRGYVLSSGPGRLSREKIQDLTGRIFDLLLEDGDVEYFVKDPDLRLAVLRGLEHELARDEARSEKARMKVRNIKRNIPEESAEFHTLFMQFYRELLDKES
jgi:uncharacterized protein